MQTNTNNVNKTWTLQRTTGGKDEPNSVLRPFENATMTTYSFYLVEPGTFADTKLNRFITICTITF